MTSSYLIGVRGVAHVTDHVTGTVTLAPGVPITDLAVPQAAVLPLVVVVAAMIVVATVMIVMVLAELVVLMVRGTFWAVRWYYRRCASSYG
jgi:hypothetical protein